MENELPEQVESRQQGFLDWLSRHSAGSIPFAEFVRDDIGNRLLNVSEQFLTKATLEYSDCFQLSDPAACRIIEEVTQYRSLNSLGVKVVLTIQWDTKRYRILRSLIPDNRYGTETSMAEQLQKQMPFASFGTPTNGFLERINFCQDRRLTNTVLFTGQLAGGLTKGDHGNLMQSDGSDTAFGLDATLDGLSLINEPFSFSIVATPLPSECLAGVGDFLLAAATVCSSGKDLTFTDSQSTTKSSGTSQLDPEKRWERAALGLAGPAAAAAILLSFGTATPVILAAGAVLGASRSMSDLFGCQTTVTASEAKTDSRQETRHKTDERMGFYSEKFKELNTLFDDGGQHGMWMWHGSVSAKSASVASAVADAFGGRLSLMGNSLSPISSRLALPSEQQAIGQAIDYGLYPRLSEPVGLLGKGYGAFIQSQTLPFLLALPNKSHSGVRAIRHLPVVRSSPLEADDLLVGQRPGEIKTNVGISLKDMTGHLLIAGRTGSGKTVLLRKLLKQLDFDDEEKRIPFLFMDFAQSIKEEDWEWVKNAQWYESGRSSELGDPMPALGLLDFYTPREYDHYVWQISDLLANWIPSEGPLSMLLTEVIHATLKPHIDSEERYWLKGEPEVPSLSSLEEKIDEVLENADGGSGRYEGELRSNLRGALITRIRRLTARPLREILEGTSSDLIQSFNEKRNLLISLAQSGSTNERCLLALLILIKLRQWLRDTKEDSQPGRPRIVVALDEAHILLRKSVERDQGSQSNIHAYAVRWFDEMMAEIRQLGASVIILDQSPSLLADSVLFSTNNKIVFPLGSGQDAKVMAASLGVDESKASALGSLPSLMGYLKTSERADLELFSLDAAEVSR